MGRLRECFYGLAAAAALSCQEATPLPENKVKPNEVEANKVEIEDRALRLLQEAAKSPCDGVLDFISRNHFRVIEEDFSVGSERIIRRDGAALLWVVVAISFDSFDSSDSSGQHVLCFREKNSSLLPWQGYHPDNSIVSLCEGGSAPAPRPLDESTQWQTALDDLNRRLVDGDGYFDSDHFKLTGDSDRKWRIQCNRSAFGGF